MTTTGTQTVKKRTASGATPPMASCLYMKPTSVLMAMSTTLVGVATFSDTRNRSVRMENVQISMPLLVEAKAHGGARNVCAGRGRGRKRRVQCEMFKRKAYPIKTGRLYHAQHPTTGEHFLPKSLGLRGHGVRIARNPGGLIPPSIYTANKVANNKQLPSRNRVLYVVG